MTSRWWRSTLSNPIGRAIQATVAPPGRVRAFAGLEQLEPRLMLDAAPVVATELGNIFLPNGMAPYTMGIDGFDGDGNPLSISARSDEPNLSVFVPSGNRFARLIIVESDGVTDIGEIVIELFDGRVPENTKRFVNLATKSFDEDGNEVPGSDPFWNNVLFHRVIPEFVIQSGDAGNGDGTGGSPLGDFPAVAVPDQLSYASPGVVGWANRGSDITTSDNQFFITAIDTSFLDANLAIIGHMVSGQETFDTVINLPRNAQNRPNDPPLIKRVEVFDSNEDGSVTLIANGDFDGRAELTITLDDGTGLVTEQSISVVRIGDRPMIEDPGLQDVVAGGSVSIPFTVMDDLFAATEVEISSDNPDLAFSVVDNEEAGRSLTLNGNTWKAINFDYDITESTILEFDFSSGAQGEIQGIGFDDDLTATGENIFKLFGTQRVKKFINDFDNYENTQPDVRHYRIPVGQFYTGPMTAMTFVNDHDVDDAMSESVFSNVMVYENTAPEDITEVRFHLRTISAYDTEQDITGEFETDAVTHFVNIELLSDEQQVFEATLSVVEADMDGIDLEPTTQTFVVSTLGDRPTITGPEQRLVSPGETLVFIAEIADDSGVPLDVTITTEREGISPTIDPATFEVSIELPPEERVHFDITLTAVEAGFDLLTATTQTITITTFGDRPVIEDAGTITIPVDAVGRFTPVISDDSDIPLAVSVTSSDSSVLVEVDPVTFEVTITPPDQNYRTFTLTVTAVEDDDAAPTQSVQQFPVITGSGLVEAGTDGELGGSFRVENRLYMTAGLGGLKVFDTTDDSAPQLLGQTDGADELDLRDVEVSGTTAFVADAEKGLVVLDVADPSAITILATFASEDTVHNVLIGDDVLFTAEGTAGISSWNIADPADISRIDTLTENIGNAFGLAQKDLVLYVGDPSPDGGLEVIDVSDPRDLDHVRTVYDGERPDGISVDGDRLYVTESRRDRLVVFNVRNARLPRELGRIGLSGDPNRVAATGDTAIVANSDGFQFIDVSMPKMMFIDRVFAGPRGEEPLLFDGHVALPFSTSGQIAIIDAADFDQRTIILSTRRFVDDLGVRVTVGIRGQGFVVAHTTGAGSGSIKRLDVRATNPRSTLLIKTHGGRTTIGDINLFGFLNRLVAKTTDLAGNVNAAAFVRALYFHDIVGPSVISIGLSFTFRDNVRVYANNITDLILDSAMPIRIIKAENWFAEDVTRNLLRAPSIKKMIFRGHFESDLVASGPFTRTDAVRMASIGGDVRQGIWKVNGQVRTLLVRGNAQNWTLLTTTLGTGTIRGDLVDSTMELIQPVDPDRASVTTNRKLAVLGFVDNSQIRSTGHLKNLTFGGLRDSSVFAGINPDFNEGLPLSFLDFAPERARIVRLTIKGIRGEPFTFINSHVAAWELKYIRLAGVRNDNDQVPFGVAGHDITKLSQPRLPDNVAPLGDGSTGNDSLVRIV